MRITSIGHAYLAATFVGLGILGLVTGHFTPVWDPVPKYVPARDVMVYVCALVSLGSGIGLFWKATAGCAARVLLALLLLWFLLLRVPFLFTAPKVEDSWSGCGETAVMLAGAWILYVRLAGGGGKRIATTLYGLAMLPFGAAHFIYLKETAGLVPAWLPAHTAIAAFTGGAFIAAGIAILSGKWARLAAILSVVQLGLFAVLVWVPIIAAGTKDPYMRSEAILSFALLAGAWVVAESY